MISGQIPNQLEKNEAGAQKKSNQNNFQMALSCEISENINKYHDYKYI